jgi:hypothetical protein
VLVIQDTMSSKDVSCSQHRGNYSYTVSCVMDGEVIDEPGININIPRETAITHFWIHHKNNVKFLPENVAETFQNIFEYSVEKCRVKIISTNNLMNMKNFDVLRLSNNEVSNIATDALGTFKILNFLDSSYNRREHLNSNIFEKLTALADLYLDPIESVDEKTFDGLVMLEQHQLYKNNLTILPKELMKNAVKIEVITLALNKLEKLHRDFIDTNLNLRIILLEENNLKVLNSKLFRHKTDLGTIDLRANVCINIKFLNNSLPENSLEKMMRTLDESCRDIKDEINETTTISIQAETPLPFHITLRVILVIDILVCLLYIITCALSKFERYI